MLSLTFCGLSIFQNIREESKTRVISGFLACCDVKCDYNQCDILEVLTIAFFL